MKVKVAPKRSMPQPAPDAVEKKRVVFLNDARIIVELPESYLQDVRQALSAAKISKAKTSPQKLKELLYLLLKTKAHIDILEAQRNQLDMKREQNRESKLRKKQEYPASFKQAIADAEKKVSAIEEQLFDNTDYLFPKEERDYLSQLISYSLRQNKGLLDAKTEKKAGFILSRRDTLNEYHKRCCYAYETAKENMEPHLREAMDQLKALVARAETARKEIEPMTFPEDAVEEMLVSEIDSLQLAQNKLYFLYYYLLEEQQIVYKKYCNHETIAVFYEYLNSGRCSSLEGPHGAYNLYEQERSTGQVLSKLSQIEGTLDQIDRTLMRIESSVDRFGQSLVQIVSSMEKVSVGQRTLREELSRLNRTMDEAFDSIRQIEASTGDRDSYLKRIAQSSHAAAVQSGSLYCHALFESNFRHMYHILNR